MACIDGQTGKLSIAEIIVLLSMPCLFACINFYFLPIFSIDSRILFILFLPSPNPSSPLQFFFSPFTLSLCSVLSCRHSIHFHLPSFPSYTFPFQSNPCFVSFLPTVLPRPCPFSSFSPPSFTSLLKPYRYRHYRSW